MSPDHWTDEQLIPVRSEGELQPGMTLVIKPCPGQLCSGRSHVFVLCGLGPDGRCSNCGEASRGWRAVGLCASTGKPKSPYGYTFCIVIRAGALFRVETGLDADADSRAAEADRVRASLLAGFYAALKRREAAR